MATEKQCKEFIEKIAPIHKKYAKEFGFKTVSGSIAQACLESAYGTSTKAKYFNLYGLKYNPKTPNRCPSASGYFSDNGSEQNADGSYSTSSMLWWKASSLDLGVKIYYEFLVNGYGKYDKAKDATTPREFLQILKNSGYATSIKYVDNVMAVVEKWNLTQYDANDVVITTNDEIEINYTLISPNRTSPRNHKIDTITIHHMAGNLSVESCGRSFSNKSRQASSNYGIGSDGRIGLYVNESDRSWCSGNRTNDHRAVTIEVANDDTTNWTISSAAMKSLIRLCADICRRNGIEKLVWSNNKEDRINHLNGANMTVHRDFQATLCPGNYLYGKMGYIADEVNKLLNGESAPIVETNPYPVPTRTLKRTLITTTGDDVKWLQWELIHRGFMTELNSKGQTNIDGKFGDGTKSCVMAMQKAYGLQVDGSVGPATRKYLIENK